MLTFPRELPPSLQPLVSPRRGGLDTYGPRHLGPQRLLASSTKKKATNSIRFDSIRCPAEPRRTMQPIGNVFPSGG